MIRGRVRLLRFFSGGPANPVFTVRCLRPGDASRVPPMERLPKSDILQRFPTLLSRDMELSNRRISEVLVRPRIFFLKLEYLRVLVSREEILVFDDSALAASFTEALAQELATASDMRPPEFLALKRALKTSTEVFQNRLALLDPMGRRLLKSVITRVDEETPLQLIPLRREISRFHTSLSSYERAFSRGNLPEGLQLGEGGDDPVVFNDLSVLLSDYGTRAEEIMNDLEDLQEELESIDATITQVLSATRNQLMRLSLQIAMAGLGTAVCAMGFGAFGMNLTSGLETAPYMFGAAVLGMSAAGGVTFGVAHRAYARSTRRFDGVAHSTLSSFFNSLSSPNFVWGLFHASELNDNHVRALLSSAMGRPVTDLEMERVKLIADSNGNREVTLAELLKFLEDWRR